MGIAIYVPILQKDKNAVFLKAIYPFFEAYSGAPVGMTYPLAKDVILW